jgi:ribosomal protein S20
MIGRRMLAAGVVAGAVAVGGVAGALIGIPGLSSASSNSTTSDTSGATGATGATGTTGPDGGRHFRGFFGLRFGADKDVIDAAAQALHLTTEQLLDKLSDGKTTIADVAEQQHVDLQTVTDAMEAVAKQDIQNLVNNPLPVPPKGFPGGPGMHDGFGFVFGLPGIKDALDPVAKALGITTDELQTDLRNGKSIADIAKAKNVDLDTIVNELVKEAQSRFDQAVKDGKLTQDQADRFEARLKERITDFLNLGLPKGLGGFGFRFHGGPDRFGPGGPWPGAVESPSGSAASTN